MTHFVYIIYSRSANKFYIGETAHLQQRIRQHKSGHYKHASTKSANDWDLFLQIECESRTQALRIERHIKKMKSRKYFENMAKYPEMKLKLLAKFSS